MMRVQRGELRFYWPGKRARLTNAQKLEQLSERCRERAARKPERRGRPWKARS
jgi:hypothetical protein